MINIEYIASLAGTALGLLITVITILSKLFKNAKLKKIAENAVKIGDAVLPFIQEAEKFANYTGAEKKAYVMTKATQFAMQNGIKFDAELVCDKIEELVALTKEVNARDKDKPKV